MENKSQLTHMGNSHTWNYEVQCLDKSKTIKFHPFFLIDLFKIICIFGNLFAIDIQLPFIKKPIINTYIEF